MYGPDLNAAVFFKTFLNMRNADYQDITDELVSRSGGPAPSENDMLEIYTALADMVHSKNSIGYVRSVQWLKTAQSRSRY